MKIASNICLFSSYTPVIMWVNNFQTPKIQAVLRSFFHDVNDIAGGSNKGGRWGWS